MTFKPELQKRINARKRRVVLGKVKEVATEIAGGFLLLGSLYIFSMLIYILG